MGKFLFLLIPIFFLGACDLNMFKKNPKSFDVSTKQQELIDNGNAFSASILKQINDTEAKDKNLFFSPFSISMALGMTLNGANGTTKEAMLDALELSGMSMDDINSSYKYLIDNLKPLDPDVVFNIANSIWYRQDYSILSDFIQLNRDHFYAEISPLDFNKSEEAKNTINNWVKDKTNGKIEEIVDKISPSSFMFLINALYFNANWTYQFDKSDTKELDFYLADDVTTSTPFVHQKMEAKSFSNDLLHAIELPYGEGNFSMVVMVPQYGKNVDDIVSEFSISNWNNWLAAMTEIEDLEIYLPKFSYEYDIELEEILTNMGMGIAFSSQADFSGINPDLALYISKVKHKAFVDVNEEGTEAAAVTSVEINYTSISQFAANKPFLYFIKERNTQAILFIGRVMDPSK